MHLIAGSFNDILQSQIPIWDKVLRTVAVYALIYILMRLAKRDAAQLTASDFVVVLLLSNVVQNAIIGPDNSFVGGAVGAVTLIVANELVARWEWARKMARADRSQQEEKERKPSPEPTGMVSSLVASADGPRAPHRRWGGRRSGRSKGSASRSWTSSLSCVDRASETRVRTSSGPSSARAGPSTTELKPEAEPATKSNIDDLHRELRELRDGGGQALDVRLASSAMDTERRRALIEQYQGGVAAVELALAGITDDELDRAPAGEWSPRMVVHHLADSETSSYLRLRKLLAESDPVLQGYDEAEWARVAALRPADRDIRSRCSTAVRASSGELLDRLSDDDWARAGTHSESGAYSVDDGWRSTPTMARPTRIRSRGRAPAPPRPEAATSSSRPCVPCPRSAA